MASWKKLVTYNSGDTITVSAPGDDAHAVNRGYVDTAVAGENMWNRVGTTLSPNTSGDNIDNIGTAVFGGNITLDSSGDARLILDRGTSTSKDNTIRFQTAGTLKWGVGSDEDTETFSIRYWNGSAWVAAFSINTSQNATFDGTILWPSGGSANANTAYTHSQIAGGNSVHVSTTENTQWDAAYTHSQVAGGNSVHVSTTENTQWDTAYTHSQIAGGNSVHVSTTENTQWDTAYTYSQVGHLPLVGGTLTGGLTGTTIYTVNTTQYSNSGLSESASLRIRNNYAGYGSNIATFQGDNTGAGGLYLSIFPHSSTYMGIQIREGATAGAVQNLKINPAGGNVEFGANVTVVGTVSAEQLTSTDDLTVAGLATITGTASMATGSTIGNLTFSNGSIIDSSGAISFGDEALSTSGTLASGTQTVTGNVIASGTVQAEQLTSTDDLTVSGLATIGETLVVTGNVTVGDTSGNSALTILAPNAGNSRLYFGDAADAGVGFIDYDHGTSMILGTAGSATLTIGEDKNSSFSGDLTVTGDLIISGDTTTLNTQTVEVEDNILQLNTTQGSPDEATAATSGISIYRGNGITQASLIFDEVDDAWDLTNDLVVAGDLDVAGDITVSASSLTIGSTVLSESSSSINFAGGVIATTGAFSGAVTGASYAGGTVSGTSGTFSTTLGVTGETTLSSHLNMGDSDIIKLGAGADLQIQHNGSASLITDAGTGALKLRGSVINIDNADSSKGMATLTDGGSVDLFYNDSKKFETTNTGISVTGVGAFSGAVTGASYSGGVVSGTSGDFSSSLSATGDIITGGSLRVDTAPDNDCLIFDQSTRKHAIKTYFTSSANTSYLMLKTSTGATGGAMYDSLKIEGNMGTFRGGVTATTGTFTGNIAVGGTVDGVDVAARDAILTSTTTTANAALPKAGGAMTGAITTNSTFDGVDVAGHVSSHPAPTNRDTRNQIAGSYQASGSYAASSHTHGDIYYTETELDTSLALKANLASPTFTGTVNTGRVIIDAAQYGNQNPGQLHIKGAASGDVGIMLESDTGGDDCFIHMTDKYHNNASYYQAGIKMWSNSFSVQAMKWANGVASGATEETNRFAINLSTGLVTIPGALTVNSISTGAISGTTGTFSDSITSTDSHRTYTTYLNTPDGGHQQCRILEDKYGKWILVGRFKANARDEIRNSWSSVRGLSTSNDSATATAFSADWGSAYPSEVRILGATDMANWGNTKTIDFVYGCPAGRQWKHFFSGGAASGMSFSGKYGFGCEGAYDGKGRWVNNSFGFWRMSDGNTTHSVSGFTSPASNGYNWGATYSDAKLGVHHSAAFGGQDTYLSAGFGEDDDVIGFFDGGTGTPAVNMDGGNDYSSQVWILIKLPAEQGLISPDTTFIPNYVGIGIRDPGSPLHIAGNFPNQWGLIVNNNSSDGGGILIDADDSDDDEYLIDCRNAGTTRFQVRPLGDIGIGTDNPGGPLGRGYYRNPEGSRSAPTGLMELVGTAGSSEMIVTSFHDSATEYAALTLRSADADHSWASDNDLAGVVAFATNDSTGSSGENEWCDIAAIKGRLASTSTNNSVSGDLEFWTNPGSMDSDLRMVILANGDVGIGSQGASPTNPSGADAVLNLTAGTASLVLGKVGTDLHRWALRTGGSENETFSLYRYDENDSLNFTALAFDASGNVTFPGDVTLSSTTANLTVGSYSGTDQYLLNDTTKRMIVWGAMDSTYHQGQLAIGSTEYGQHKGGTLGFVIQRTSGTLAGSLSGGSISVRKEDSANLNYATYMTFYTRAHGGNPTEQMRITSAGNVGIGTTNPAYGQLQVSKSVDGNFDALVLENPFFDAGSTNDTVSLNFRFGGEAGKIVVGKEENYSGPTERTSYMAFYTNDENSYTEKMRIDRYGNVGIGTNSPDQKLEIESSDNTSILRLRETTGQDGIWDLKANSNNSFHILGSSDGSAVTEYLTIDETGNVGIGTNNPTAVLDIATTADFSQDLKIRNDTVTMRMYASSANVFNFMQTTNNDMVFFTNDTERFRIAAGGAATFSGDVSMGALDVAGGLTIAGNIIVGANRLIGSHYLTDCIREIQMGHGGQIAYGDHGATNALGISEGLWDTFTDTDNLSIYCRQDLKIYGYNSNASVGTELYATFDRLQVTFPGNLTVSGHITDVKVYNHLKLVGSDNTFHASIRGAGNTFEVRTSASETIAMTIDGSQNTVFTGTINSGAITSTGLVTGNSSGFKSVNGSKTTQFAYDGVYTAGAQNQYFQSAQHIYFYPGNTLKHTFHTDGSITFGGTILPLTNNVYNIGASNKYILNAYLYYMHGSTLTLGSTATFNGAVNVNSTFTMSGADKTFNVTNTTTNGQTTNWITGRNTQDHGISHYYKDTSGNVRGRITAHMGEGTLGLALAGRNSGFGDLFLNSSGYIGIGTHNPNRHVHIYRDDTSDTQSQLKIAQDGTGDATLGFVLTGVAGWGMGIDNSDGDSFKISTDTDILHSGTRLTIDRSGNTTFSGNIVCPKLNKTYTRYIDTPNGGVQKCRVLEDEHGTWILVGRFAANAQESIRGTWSSARGLETSNTVTNVTSFSADWGDSYPTEVRVLSATDFDNWGNTKGIDFVYGVPEGRPWKYFFSSGLTSGMLSSTKYGFECNGAYDGKGRWNNPSFGFWRMSDGNTTHSTSGFTTPVSNGYNWGTADDGKLGVHHSGTYGGQDTALTSGFGEDDNVVGFFDQWPGTSSNMGGGQNHSSQVWILIKVPGFSEETGIVNTSGNMSVKPEVNSTHTFGMSRLFSPFAGYAAFAHHDRTANTDYALLQHSGGTTYLNCKSGTQIYIRTNNATIGYFDSGGFYNESRNVYQARYATGSTNNSANFGWNGLQLGNNAANYIVAGNTATGGAFQFVTNNSNLLATDNFGSYNGTAAMLIQANALIYGDFVDTSDVGLKENVVDISDGTTVIKALRPVNFDWKQEDKGNGLSGFIAQEVEEVLPNDVHGDNYDPEVQDSMGKAINTVGILSQAVKAIQELEARIAELES